MSEAKEVKIESPQEIEKKIGEDNEKSEDVKGEEAAVESTNVKLHLDGIEIEGLKTNKKMFVFISIYFGSSKVVIPGTTLTPQSKSVQWSNQYSLEGPKDGEVILKIKSHGRIKDSTLATLKIPILDLPSKQSPATSFELPEEKGTFKMAAFVEREKEEKSKELESTNLKNSSSTGKLKTVKSDNDILSQTDENTESKNKARRRNSNKNGNLVKKNTFRHTLRKTFTFKDSTTAKQKAGADGDDEIPMAPGSSATTESEGKKANGKNGDKKEETVKEGEPNKEITTDNQEGVQEPSEKEAQFEVPEEKKKEEKVEKKVEENVVEKKEEEGVAEQKKKEENVTDKKGGAEVVEKEAVEEMAEQKVVQEVSEDKVEEKVPEKKVEEEVTEKKVEEVTEKKVEEVVAEEKVEEVVAEKKVEEAVAEKKVEEVVAEKKVKQVAEKKEEQKTNEEFTPKESLQSNVSIKVNSTSCADGGEGDSQVKVNKLLSTSRDYIERKTSIKMKKEQRERKRVSSKAGTFATASVDVSEKSDSDTKTDTDANDTKTTTSTDTVTETATATEAIKEKEETPKIDNGKETPEDLEHSASQQHLETEINELLAQDKKQGEELLEILQEESSIRSDRSEEIDSALLEIQKAVEEATENTELSSQIKDEILSLLNNTSRA